MSQSLFFSFPIRIARSPIQRGLSQLSCNLFGYRLEQDKGIYCLSCASQVSSTENNVSINQTGAPRLTCRVTKCKLWVGYSRRKWDTDAWVKYKVSPEERKAQCSLYCIRTQEWLRHGARNSAASFTIPFVKYWEKVHYLTRRRSFTRSLFVSAQKFAAKKTFVYFDNMPQWKYVIFLKKKPSGHPC